MELQSKRKQTGRQALKDSDSDALCTGAHVEFKGEKPEEVHMMKETLHTLVSCRRVSSSLGWPDVGKKAGTPQSLGFAAVSAGLRGMNGVCSPTPRLGI